MSASNVGGNHLIVVGVPIFSVPWPSWFEGDNGVMHMMEPTVVVEVAMEGNNHARQPPRHDQRSSNQRNQRSLRGSVGSGHGVRRTDPSPSSSNAHFRAERDDSHPVSKVEEPCKKFLVEYKCSMTLAKACLEFNICQPMYTLCPTIQQDGKDFFAFRATIRTFVIGHPLHCIGSYYPSEDLAREDVARKLLGRLLAATTKEIGDYNYENMVELQDKLRSLKILNAELKMENGFLNQQLDAPNIVGNDH
ncbi:hypothetical protein SESBI_46304 [Sesbania bispinosa]|nr:hypothetical protein SESBI_46304 [Sesbania bispinosa]